MCQGRNSHYFHMIEDGKLNPIVGVYIPIIRIPIKGGMTIPNKITLAFMARAQTVPRSCEERGKTDAIAWDQKATAS